MNGIFIDYFATQPFLLFYMIQRIQTVYLFLVVVINSLLLFIPLANINFSVLGEASYSLTSFRGTGATPEVILSPSLLLIFEAIIIALLALITIFLYNKRRIQIRLCTLNIFLNIGLILSIFFYLEKYVENTYGKVIIIDYKAGAYLPAISLFLLFLALRGVKKDEALVRSADRLR